MDLKAPWYPVPPYKNEGWTLLNRDGELVATFEAREECEYVSRLINNSLDGLVYGGATVEELIKSGG